MPDQDFKYIPVLSEGLNKEDPTDVLRDGESPNLKNVIFRGKMVQSDTGYKKFGVAVRGYPQAVEQLWLKAGSSELLLITTLTFYKWVNSEWEYVSNGTSTTVTGDQGAGTANLVVAASTGFVATEHIGVIIKNNGTTKQHQTTVASIPDGTHITMDDAIPTGWTAKNGAAVVEAAVLAGNLDYPVKAAQWVPDDWLMFTNNVDCPQRYSAAAATCIDMPNLETGAGGVKARHIRVFENHVLLMGMSENAVALPQRIRWCDAGDPTEWTTGTASYEDLYDSEDFVLCSAGLGPYEIVYRERSVYRMTYVGTAALLFRFEPLVVGEGIIGSAALAVLEDRHIFMNNADIYEYTGGFDVTPVGGRGRSKIRSYIFGSGGVLNPSNRGRVRAAYTKETDEVWFLIPTGANTVLDTTLRYTVSESTWSIREFYHTVLGIGFHQRDASLSWDEDVGPWDEDVGTWDARSMLANAPMILLCGHTPKQIYEYDYLQSQDDGNIINWEFQTKDFYGPAVRVRQDYIKFKAKGSSVSVYYSTDRGVSWTLLETVTLSSILIDHQIWKQIVYNTVRYRFLGTGSGFVLQSLGFSLSEESEW